MSGECVGSGFTMLGCSNRGKGNSVVSLACVFSLPRRLTSHGFPRVPMGLHVGSRGNPCPVGAPTGCPVGSRRNPREVPQDILWDTPWVVPWDILWEVPRVRVVRVRVYSRREHASFVSVFVCPSVRSKMWYVPCTKSLASLIRKEQVVTTAVYYISTGTTTEEY